MGFPITVEFRDMNYDQCHIGKWPADDLSTIFPVFVMKIFCKLILALCLAFEKKKNILVLTL